MVLHICNKSRIKRKCLSLTLSGTTSSCPTSIEIICTLCQSHISEIDFRLESVKDLVGPVYEMDNKHNFNEVNIQLFLNTCLFHYTRVPTLLTLQRYTMSARHYSLICLNSCNMGRAIILYIYLSFNFHS